MDPARTESRHSQEAERKEDDADDAKPRLAYSGLIGRPTSVLDPEGVKNGFRPFPDTGVNICSVDDKTLVKFGKYIRLREAEAMKYVRENTSIACPEVYSAYELEGVGYIIMSWEQGMSLSQFWEKAPRRDKDTVLANLSAHVAEMRSLKSDYIGGFGENACNDEEFQWDYEQDEKHQYGPYADEAAFLEGLIEAMDRATPTPRSQDPESRSYNNSFKLDALIRSLHGHETVFTHGDLHTSNVLVRDDLSVVILDWANAGFYPAYWEFWKATRFGFFRESFIQEVIKYIPPFWIEANIMQQINDIILG